MNIRVEGRTQADELVDDTRCCVGVCAILVDSENGKGVAVY